MQHDYNGLFEQLTCITHESVQGNTIMSNVIPTSKFHFHYPKGESNKAVYPPRTRIR